LIIKQKTEAKAVRIQKQARDEKIRNMTPKEMQHQE